jgi:plasmid stabilization system protein ParE
LKVLFTPTGREQFLAALAYIRRDNPRAARALRVKAEKALIRLATFPESGRSLPEFPELPYREVVVPPYRFFYLATGGRVWVVAVWHTAQLPETP